MFHKFEVWPDKVVLNNVVIPRPPNVTTTEFVAFWTDVDNMNRQFRHRRAFG